MDMLYLLAIALLIILYAPITSLAYSRGRSQARTVNYFSEQPMQAHPDRELIAENEELRALVAELDAEVKWTARTYLELIAERLELRHKLADSERLRAKWHRLYRKYRGEYLWWRDAFGHYAPRNEEAALA